MKSIRTRLLLYFLLMSVFSLVAVGFASYLILVSTLKEKANTVMANTVEQIGKNVESRMDIVEMYTFLVFSNERIQTLLESNSFKDFDTVSLYAAYKELDSILSYYFYNDKYLLSAVILSVKGGRYVYKDSAANIEMSENPDYLNKMKMMDGSVQWIGPKQVKDQNGREIGLFAVSRVLKDIKNTNPLHSLGRLDLTFSEDMLSDIYESFHTDENSDIMIVDQNGQVISHKDKMLFSLNLGGEPYIESVLSGDDGVFVHKYNNVKSLVSFHKLAELNWWVIEFVPYSYITAQIKYIILLTLLLCGACLLGIYACSLYLSARLAKPLKQLNNAMKEVEKGNFELYVNVDSRDEVGQIKTHFNRMVRRIDELFKETIHQEREKKKEELKALQYQVNPHFLYNTLNSVRLMAMLSKATHVATMIEALIRMLRNTIGKHGTMVPVSMEIKNIQDFILIQNIRNNNRIEVECHIDENIADCLIPHFLLQPLVENSIVHGFDQKSGKGILVIRGSRWEDDMLFSLEDNGFGMTEVQIRNILTGENRGNKYTSIGIKNVIDRIKINFGPDYGLNIQSVVGEGTRVVVRLPVIRKNGEDE